MSNLALALKAGNSLHWTAPTIGEVCRLINGRAYKKDELLDGGRYRVLRVGNFFTSNQWYFSDLELDDDKYCNDGDLLYAWSASFGPRVWSGEKTIYHYHIWKVEPDLTKVLRDFLFYFFEWDKELIRKEQGTGATMTHVAKGSMEARAIPLPPLDEQRRIVAVLDQAFAALDRARAHAEANLADAQDLFVRQRETLLNGNKKRWPAMTVNDVCERFEYGTSTKSLPEGRVPVLRMGNLQHGELDWSSLVYTDDKGDIEKLALHADDVLFNRTNSTEHVGKTAIFRGERDAIFAGYLIRLHVRKTIINPEYLNIFLNSNAARGYGRTVMGKSVNQANISASKLRTYPIDVPSLAEQEAIVENLLCIREQTGRLKNAFETKLADLANLRQSLLQKAFSGHLT